MNKTLSLAAAIALALNAAALAGLAGLPTRGEQWLAAAKAGAGDPLMMATHLSTTLPVKQTPPTHRGPVRAGGRLLTCRGQVQASARPTRTE